MRTAYDVIVYGAAEADWETEGLVGPLVPTKCEHTAEAGGDSTVELTHPYDAEGRWMALQPGNFLKVWVQDHVPPVMDGTTIRTTVEVYTISAGATKAQRKVYNKRENGKCVKTLSVGTQVVVKDGIAQNRWKITSGKVTGWIDPDALHYETQIEIPDGPSGVESLFGVEVREQIFEIRSVERGEKEVTVYAEHQTDRLRENVTTWKSAGAVTLGGALTGIAENALEPLGVELHTNLSDQRTGLDFRMWNVLKALLDPEEGVCGRWTCEVLRDNEDMYFLDHAGVDRGVVIEFGRNCRGAKVKVDTSDLATYIVPVGEDKNGAPMMLPEHWVVSPHAEDYPRKYIYVFDAKDAREDKDTPKSVCYTRMREQAQALLDGGCDLPRVTLDVDVLQLDTPESMGLIEALEPMLLYDRVKVIVPEMEGIGDGEAAVRVSKRVWDCLRGRVISLTLSDTYAAPAVKVSSWQIGSVSGAKLLPGTVGGSALPNDIVSARLIQAGAVQTQALDAECVTAEKMDAVSVDAHNLQAAIAHVNQLTYDVAHGTTLEAGTLAASIAALNIVTAASATMDEATVKALFASVGILDEATITRLWADHVRTNYLRAGRAVIEECIFLHNGAYYAIQVGEGGELTATEVETPSEEEIDDGRTEDGTPVVSDGTVYDNLYTGGPVELQKAFDLLAAKTLHVQELFAQKGTIEAMKTAQIAADLTLEVIAGAASDTRKWFDFDNLRGLIVRKPEYTDEHGVVHPASIWYTVTDEVGYHIKCMEIPGYVGSFSRGGLIAKGVQMGEMLCKPTSTGGWVWVDSVIEEE